MSQHRRIDPLKAVPGRSDDFVQKVVYGPNPPSAEQVTRLAKAMIDQHSAHNNPLPKMAPPKAQGAFAESLICLQFFLTAFPAARAVFVGFLIFLAALGCTLGATLGLLTFNYFFARAM